MKLSPGGYWAKRIDNTSEKVLSKTLSKIQSNLRKGPMV